MEQEKIIAEINALKEANRELSKILNEVIRQVMDNNELCSKFIEENGIIKAFFSQRLDNLPYEIFDPRYRHKYDIPKIMTEEETIDEIVKNRKSICRFGDGEFSIMFGSSRWRFQRDDAKLAERLREVITTEEENILIGLNDFYGYLTDKTEY